MNHDRQNTSSIHRADRVYRYSVIVTSAPWMDRVLHDGFQGRGRHGWTVRVQLEEDLDVEDGHWTPEEEASDGEHMQVERESSELRMWVSEERAGNLADDPRPDEEARTIRQVVDRAIQLYDQQHTVTFPESGTLDLTGRPALMGVLNVTPDSFSDGGRYDSVEEAVERGQELAAQGASIVDVGGESTRPGADPVPVQEEIDRTVPVVRALAERLPVPVSIDTRKPEVAQAAIDAGAEMINDVGGLQREPELAELASKHDLPVVAMHMQGTPQNMQEDPTYEDVRRDLFSFFRISMDRATDAGLERCDVFLDPGIGFGKTLTHNLELVKHAHEFRSLGGPVLLGTSRKSFIGEVLDVPVEQRIEGTAASLAGPALTGVEMFRVHDVQNMYRFLKMLWTVQTNTSWSDQLLSREGGG